MSEATGRAARRTVQALNHRVMCELEAAALACIGAEPAVGADAGVRHVVLVDEAAFGDDGTRAELARRARAGVALEYVRDVAGVDAALARMRGRGGDFARLASISVLFHGQARDARGAALDACCADFGARAAAVCVLGKWIGVDAKTVDELKQIADVDASASAASRAKYPDYWAVRDALRGANAAARGAEIYLYACSLASIGGLRDLFAGCGYTVLGSTDVTGPAPRGNWDVEWCNTGHAPTDDQRLHASRALFDDPDAMGLELRGGARAMGLIGTNGRNGRV